MARQWPVDGVVGENGAFYFRYDDGTHRMTRRYAKTAAERNADRAKLDLIMDKVLSSEDSGTALASDQAYREADLAMDFAEDVKPLAPPPLTPSLGFSSAMARPRKFLDPRERLVRHL